MPLLVHCKHGTELVTAHIRATATDVGVTEQRQQGVRLDRRELVGDLPAARSAGLAQARAGRPGGILVVCIQVLRVVAVHGGRHTQAINIQCRKEFKLFVVVVVGTEGEQDRVTAETVAKEHVGATVVGVLALDRHIDIATARRQAEGVAEGQREAGLHAVVERAVGAHAVTVERVCNGIHEHRVIRPAQGNTLWRVIRVPKQPRALRTIHGVFHFTHSRVSARERPPGRPGLIQVQVLALTATAQGGVAGHRRIIPRRHFQPNLHILW